MPEGAGGGLRLRIDRMPHRPALHDNDRMVAVLASDRGGEPQDEPGLGPADDLLEAPGRQMVTLVHDDLAVLRHAILDDALVDQALNHGHVQRTGCLLVAASYAANRLGRQTEEHRQPLDPLLQQLAAMHEDQRIDAALGDQPGGNDRLAEGGRGRQNARFMPQHLLGDGRLLRPQFALKLHVQSDARVSLVARDGLDVQVREELLHIFQTAAGQAR